MSYWAAYSGQGLALSRKEFNAFLEKYASVAGEDDTGVKELEQYADDYIGIDEVHFTKPGTEETFEFACADDGCCEGFRLWNYRINGKKNEDYNLADIPMEDVYFLESDRQLDGMDCFDGPVYASYEDFVQEFKDKLAVYLPKDFDWDGHIGIYTYACYA